LRELIKSHLLCALCPKRVKKRAGIKNLLALRKNNVDISRCALLPNHFAVLAQLRKILVVDLICTFRLRCSRTLESVT
jgi:hypothetical protein